MLFKTPVVQETWKNKSSTHEMILSIQIPNIMNNERQQKNDLHLKQ